MKKNFFLGIDTSNYTTSLALVDENGALIANSKKMLPVRSGECGLRQADAVFSHIKNLPLLFNDIKKHLEYGSVVAVGVSSKPRNIEGSYMPCFLVGVSEAAGIATMLGVPLYTFSHQCGHIMAAIFSSGNLDILKLDSFASFHISGGTTELLKNKYSHGAFDAEIVGGTSDLNAGQLIDRVGVYMGLDFPCGREMELLADSYVGKISKRKAKTNGMTVNLSGIENLAKALYDETCDKALVSAFLFNYIADMLILMSKAYIEKYGDSLFVCAGGVMSNRIIKNKLEQAINCYFAEPDMSRDNAVGIAYLTYLNHTSDKAQTV